MTRNLYKILEVDENASIDDIKKSYKKLALIHHPDKNKDKPDAEAKFKEISNAYSILSNPETKEKYDHLGDERFNNDSGGGPDMPNMDDLFQHLFGGRRANPFGNPFGNPFEQHDNSNQCGHVMKS